MSVSYESIRDLHEITGAGVIQCKKVLEETGGDMKEAVQRLQMYENIDSDTEIGFSTFADKLRFMSTEEQQRARERAWQREEEDKQRTERVRGLESIEGSLKDKLKRMAKNNLISRGAYLALLDNAYYPNFDIFSASDKQSLNKLLGDKRRVYHGPTRGSIPISMGETMVYVQFSPEEVVTVFNKLGLTDVSYKVIEHKYIIKTWTKKEKGIDKYYLYSFSY